MTKLAELIAKEEGFFKSGSLPARNHNPGDLRHSPHSQHSSDPNAIGVIDSDADGWADLERQLRIDAERGMTLLQFVQTYAPPEENNTTQYLAFLCYNLGLSPSDTVARALEIT